MQRKAFREQCLERDSNTCTVPWCEQEADDVHHIIERAEWADGGYIPRNGASVCNPHHRDAEANRIPPQAFWAWIGLEPTVPEGYTTTDVNKWGDEFATPPHESLREYHKYPSSRHLPYSHSWDKDDSGHNEVECFLDIPLVVTIKMDGGNAMIVSDKETPIRARKGSGPGQMKGVDTFEELYWRKNCYEKIPNRLQIFGEWLYDKHNIHYGCDCDQPCARELDGKVIDDVGPALGEYASAPSYFQIFGVFDTKLNMWLSWDATEWWADELGFPTVPVICRTQYERVDQIYGHLRGMALNTVEQGHEGIVVRSRFPFHYGQFDERIGKYVRPNHVHDEDEHHSKREVIPNRLAADNE